MPIHVVPTGTAQRLVDLLTSIEHDERLVCAPVEAGDQWVVVTEPRERAPRTTDAPTGKAIAR